MIKGETYSQDEYWMKIALEEAKSAIEKDEIPVGGVIVKHNELVFKTHNLTKSLHNPLAHTEKLLIEQALLHEKYLYDYTLYVTLEPCLMCSGMIILSRIGRVVYGTKDYKAGACGSVYQVLQDKSFNHHPQLTYGILQDKCSEILKTFFERKRIVS